MGIDSNKDKQMRRLLRSAGNDLAKSEASEGLGDTESQAEWLGSAGRRLGRVSEDMQQRLRADYYDQVMKRAERLAKERGGNAKDHFKEADEQLLDEKFPNRKKS